MLECLQAGTLARSEQGIQRLYVGLAGRLACWQAGLTRKKRYRVLAVELSDLPNFVIKAPQFHPKVGRLIFKHGEPSLGQIPKPP
jgi:hypothetical protein